MDAAAAAMKRLNVSFIVEFASDPLEHCQKVLKAAHSPGIIWPEILDDVDSKPTVDV